MVLAVDSWPGSRWVLLESMAKRAEHLDWALSQLGIGDRVRVDRGRAEHAGRVDEPLRHACALVTARAFGAPHLTAEAAAPMLAVGGHLVVSEPPGSVGERWPEDGLLPLGLRPDGVVRSERAGYMVFTQVSLCPPGYPRSWKRQSRHPLFR
ncbi:MAG: hypothetical protein M3010_12010 [Candidatus Dormibacteraeota bacterium]|nr:hypothetical protein [Candidatus Dormibacteraeota bacterium]